MFSTGLKSTHKPLWETLALLIAIFLVLAPGHAFGAEKNKPAPVSAAPQPEAEQVDVDKIKEKYWAKGNESELGVVQNRLFSKAGHFQLGVFGGVNFSDPFLSVKPVGFSFGFHFSEYVGLNFLFFKSLVSNSSALDTFEENRHATANTNKPNFYTGAELNWSLLYGKLSVVGKSIIYYDMHLSAGMGVTKTESGSYVTPSFGLGQRFYLSKLVSFRFDYRMMVYKENIVEKQITAILGTVVGDRTNFSNVMTFGFDFLFSSGNKENREGEQGK
ncbi:MAG: outer membrane beta-barrel domain-containing protein [Bacteriovoracia bacterium]